MNTEKQYPLVSIISINYNQSQVTCEMLESLRKISYPNIEIIIVDNNSPSDNPSVIKEKYPEINLILSDKNLGFAGGNNLGIRASKGEYLLFLNNDTEVDKGFLEPLVEFLANNPDAGAVSPKIKFFKSENKIQYAGYTEMSALTIRNSGIGYNEDDNGQYEAIKEVPFVHGAAMVVPRNVIEKAGNMPEVYFLYYEEYDWAEMIKRGGYSLYYFPYSTIWHKESVSTGNDSPFKTFYVNRNRVLWCLRNRKGLTRVASLTYLLLISSLVNIVRFTIKRKFKHLYSYLNALSYFFVPGKLTKITNTSLK